ncbi:hypothetical protein BT93_J1043 [Corymbia citriodora subsp. variegata]|nr:hypothetical protein BT93_J1043 [Corymbia citriodora subsp. variegata]
MVWTLSCWHQPAAMESFSLRSSFSSLPVRRPRQHPFRRSTQNAATPPPMFTFTRKRDKKRGSRICCTSEKVEFKREPSSDGVGAAVDDVDDKGSATTTSSSSSSSLASTSSAEESLWEWVVLVSPFFFWGTAMVAMKEILPKAGPFFVSSFRLIPAGFLLVAFAASRGRKPPSGLNAWLSITLFALVDASLSLSLSLSLMCIWVPFFDLFLVKEVRLTCWIDKYFPLLMGFLGQGFLAEGLQRTSAGLGSVIIDSQPLTVAILAALLFGESIGLIGGAGLILGVVGLLLLEVPAVAVDDNNFSLWGSGEWWMLLAAQSMAIGTVMVRWVSKYSDPVMATGWHMVIGGLPLAIISILNHDPIFTGGLSELSVTDISALLYTSICGSAISYGVFYYNATKGSLTKLSSLTFLTPMFASIFGYIFLHETFSPLQLGGAFITLIAIYMINNQNSLE